MNYRSESSRRIRVQILVFVTSCLLAWTFGEQPWSVTVEYAIFDNRMTEFREDAVLPDDVKVVLIDESSLAYMAPTLGSFPWPRTVYAELIDFFQLGGAKAVLFDILFTEPEFVGFGQEGVISEHDQRLAEASGYFPGAVHAMLLNTDIEDSEASTLNKPLPKSFAQRFKTELGEELALLEQNTYTLPIPVLLETTPTIGVVGVDPDPDGIYRRVKPLWGYQGDAYPALSLTPFLVDDATLQYSRDRNELRVDERVIPLDDQSRMLINFYGDMAPISIARVFQGWDQIMSGDVENLAIDPFTFENKVVFIGASAIGLEDTKPMTNDAKAPGVYLHASAYANMLTDEIIQPFQKHITLGTILVFTLFATVSAFNIPWLTVKISLLVGVPLLWWFTTGYFLAENVQVNLTQPLLGFSLGWVWSFTYISFTEGATKRRVKRMLSQYVSETMMNEVLAQPDEIIHAGIGKTETLSVLFSDVRGFTVLSEALPAEQVVTLLNCHFSEMAEAIFTHQGTLDKFIGDAIMAYWGAPIKVEQHADLSVNAALEMMQKLDIVNQRLEEQSLPTIEIGIGINTGSVVLGNIGSDRKLDYTVIGDAVNVASRMEGITKNYGVPIVISESTRMTMVSARPCLLLDHVRVKGKTEPVAIYCPLFNAEEEPDLFEKNLKLAEVSQRAFSYYQTQQWEKAEAAYEELDHTFLRTMFLERIRGFRENPPSKEWDGVYTFTTK